VLGETITRCRVTGRRQIKRFLIRFGTVAEFMVELASLRHDVGILQIEKGNLEAEVRILQHRTINPPEPHPPTNPLGYVPEAIPAIGQAYRVFLAGQLYGTPTPTITGVAADGEYLQVGLGRYGDGKFGPRWIAVDLYDPSPAVDHHYDVHDLPADWNGRFALAMCCAILEHIHDPQKAIDELYRVLAPAGFLYAELPFWQAYHSGGDSTIGEKYEFGGDFWRATVEGLRVWMAEFDEISCGWANEGVVFFLGRKPA
jgi:SAM-dependent methyltransferase